MREFSIEWNLKKTLKKLFKRDKVMYDALTNKMQEILTCDNVNHYKNLRRSLQEFKRVHVKSSFILIFKCIEREDKVIFYDFDHHDNIYNR